jgi:hypothetical protein
MLLRFILLLKNLCFSSIKPLFEKNSHLNLNFVEVPTFFHKVIRIVRPFYTWNPSKVQLPNLSQQVCSSKGKYLNMAKFSTKENLNVYTLMTF